MKWDIHIYNPKSKKTITYLLEVPNTKSINDVRVVYIAAQKKYQTELKYMLAIPHIENHQGV